MSKKDYSPAVIYFHDTLEVVRAAAELRGLTMSAYVRLTSGEQARIEVNQRVMRIDNASDR